MDETTEFDQLLNDKSSVEDEGRKLDEEQRQLKLRAKVLTERIVQELRTRNNSKRDDVYKLKSTVNDLESQLNALTVPTVIEDTNESVESHEETVETTETVSEEPIQTVEATVNFPEETAEEALILSQEPQETVEAVVTTPEEPAETVEDTISVAEVAEETHVDSKHKKKRRYF